MITFPVELTKDLILGFLLLVFLGFGIFSLILDFHWKQYTLEIVHLRTIRIVYFSVSILLLLGMLFSFLSVL